VIRAFKQASAATGVALKLLIIGDGDQKESLRELVAKDENIVLLGFQEKEMVPYWYNLSDAFVFASRYDGWALVINEALAAGKPVVASTATGAATDRLSSDNSFLIDPEDVNGFANAMIKLANDKNLGSQLVMQTREIARELSSAYNAQKIYDICRHAE
ncbi:MAG: glycosyltransferase, partial [Chitinophagaceae bacterium]